eukprot:365137-Chlamydomonas_euryale.AAC.6
MHACMRRCRRLPCLLPAGSEKQGWGQVAKPLNPMTYDTESPGHKQRSYHTCGQTITNGGKEGQLQRMHVARLSLTVDAWGSYSTFVSRPEYLARWGEADHVASCSTHTTPCAATCMATLQKFLPSLPSFRQPANHSADSQQLQPAEHPLWLNPVLALAARPTVCARVQASFARRGVHALTLPKRDAIFEAHLVVDASVHVAGCKRGARYCRDVRLVTERPAVPGLYMWLCPRVWGWDGESRQGGMNVRAGWDELTRARERERASKMRVGISGKDAHLLVACLGMSVSNAQVLSSTAPRTLSHQRVSRGVFPTQMARVARRCGAATPRAWRVAPRAACARAHAWRCRSCRRASARVRMHRTAAAAARTTVAVNQPSAAAAACVA